MITGTDHKAYKCVLKGFHGVKDSESVFIDLTASFKMTHETHSTVSDNIHVRFCTFITHGDIAVC